MKIPCFVISFNRLTFLKRQLEYLVKHPRLDVIIVDNNSTYEPLIQYLNEIPKGVSVIFCDKNYGHTVIWDAKLSEIHSKDKPYIVTDCDIIPDHVQANYIEMLEDGLKHYSNHNKIGLGLNTNQIPSGFIRREEVINHETKFIHRKDIGSMFYYEAPVDTTFAMYRGGYHHYSIWGTQSNQWQGECKSLRMAKPYEATHLGWHITDKNEEMDNYFKTSLNTTGHWKL